MKNVHFILKIMIKATIIQIFTRIQLVKNLKFNSVKSHSVSLTLSLNKDLLCNNSQRIAIDLDNLKVWHLYFYLDALLSTKIKNFKDF